jgi:threonine aldolase
MKQRGALLAKGRVLGVQFSTLLEGDLFFQLADHANKVAAEMSFALKDLGYKLWTKTESNQIFVVFPPALIQKLQNHFEFYVWEKLDDESLVVRIVTSWATDRSEGERFCKMVEMWTKKQ